MDNFVHLNPLQNLAEIMKNYENFRNQELENCTTDHVIDLLFQEKLLSGRISRTLEQLAFDAEHLNELCQLILSEISNYKNASGFPQICLQKVVTSSTATPGNFEAIANSIGHNITIVYTLFNILADLRKLTNSRIQA